MARMVNKITTNSMGPHIENWEFTNGLKASIALGTLMYEMTISSNSGDVSDQIHSRLQSIELFKDVKLMVLATYSLGFDKHLVQEIIDYVEGIDVNILKTGKSY